MAINDKFIKDLTNQINNVEICSQLQTLANQASAYIQDLIDQLADQAEALINQTGVPHDLSSAIKWIKKQIEPKYRAALLMLAQIEQVIQDGYALVAAIENAADKIINCEIGVSVEIPIPQIVIDIEQLNRGFNPFAKDLDRIKNDLKPFI